MGKIVAICTGPRKGERKTDIGRARLIKEQGLEGDAHAGSAHRQVSLLALESIEKMQRLGLEVGPGDFAENLTTRAINLVSLPVGTRLAVGEGAVLRITQVGKECHQRCTIYHRAGDCVMPREGVFAEVLRGGTVATGDPISTRPSYNFAVITASDRGAAGDREDQSGPAASAALKPWGDVTAHQIVPDELEQLAAALRRLADSNKIDAIFTTGGTGLSPRDVTPEATRRVVERLVPGIPEALRRESAKITPMAMLSRGVAGIRGKTLIINLPGSPGAVKEYLQILAPALDHALEVLTGRARECARGD